MQKHKKKTPAPRTQVPPEQLVMVSREEFPKQVLYFGWIVFALVCLLYSNTLSNGYALDDGIVISDNKVTQKGFGGIWETFTSDTFTKTSGAEGELSGGRYRPLSIATFAMEYGIFGANPMVSHLVNLLLYAWLCMLLFRFFSRGLFPSHPISAFFSALLFAVHPLHTEVVSNIKGRDEILCLILLLGSVLLYLEHFSSKNIKALIGAYLLFFFSLFSKENGVTFIAAIPLMTYYFRNKTVGKAILSGVPFLLITLLFFIIRTGVVGMSSSSSHEVMNVPYALATASEAFATKVMIMGKYLVMLVFPHPLSFDYSYQQIPYVGIGDWKFLSALLVNIAIIVLGIRMMMRKHLLGFCIAFYFITLSIVTNFVFNVGSPFNERFLFQPSIGFACAMGLLLLHVPLKGVWFDRKKIPLYAACTIVIFAGALKTYLRNPEWKDNDTLFMADTRHAPNSARTHVYNAVTLIHKAEKDSLAKHELFDRALDELRIALTIYPSFADAHINMGNIFEQSGQLDSAYLSLCEARKIYPHNRVLTLNLSYLGTQYLNRSMVLFQKSMVDSAIAVGERAIDCKPSDASIWYNVGGYYLTKQNVVKARELWTKARDLDPANKEIRDWLTKIGG